MEVVYSALLLNSILLVNSLSCVDKSGFCATWKQHGYCDPTSQYFNRIKPYCQKTCALCAIPLPTGKPCTDKMGPTCRYYKDYCSDPGYIDYLKTNCKNMCNFCHLTTTAPPTTKYIPTQPYTGPGGRAIQPGCGKKGPGHTRIVGGKNAKPGDWPWQVNIDNIHNYINPGHVCGGTLITEEWVVSAAHCFYDDMNKKNYILKLGEHDIKTNSSWEQKFGIDEILLHPNYTNKGYLNDLALLRLNRNATLNSRVQTACLPGQDVTFPTGTKCYITGWGFLKSYGTGPAILQQGQVPLASHSECKHAYNNEGFKITPSMLCAGYKNGTIDACTGDSGGPLVCTHHDQSIGEDVWYLWGTISWGIECAKKGLYGVYTDSKYMRAWIDSIVFKGKI